MCHQITDHFSGWGPVWREAQTFHQLFSNLSVAAMEGERRRSGGGGTDRRGGIRSRNQQGFKEEDQRQRTPLYQHYYSKSHTIFISFHFSQHNYWIWSLWQSSFVGCFQLQLNSSELISEFILSACLCEWREPVCQIWRKLSGCLTTLC